MKKYFILCAACLILAGCTTSKKEKTSQSSNSASVQSNGVYGLKGETSKGPIGNHSSLSASDVGREMVIFGLIKKNDNVFILNENPDSRSCVSFILDVDKNLIAKMEKLDGQYASLKLEITDASKAWTKYARVLEVME